MMQLQLHFFSTHPPSMMAKVSALLFIRLKLVLTHTGAEGKEGLGTKGSKGQQAKNSRVSMD